MTNTLIYRPLSHSGDYSPSYATSKEAQTLITRIRAWLSSTARAYSLRGQAERELADTFLDSRDENWDGYGACPIADASFLRAQALLARLLNRFPAPTASATPNGSLTLEWILNPQRRFMLSVDGDEQIAYAGVFGDETVQGVAQFVCDVPREIIAQLSRLYYNA